MSPQGLARSGRSHVTRDSGHFSNALTEEIKMVSGKNSIRLGAFALAAAVAATSAQAVDTLKLAIGVRETATTAPIDGNGSTLGTGGTSQIEGINWTLAQAP